MTLTNYPLKAISLAALCAVLFSAPNSRAATITSPPSTIAASDAAGYGSVPMTASFTLPQFNGALGTLTAVHIDFALTYQGEADVLNFSGNPGATFNSASSLNVPINITAVTAPPLVVPPILASNTVPGGGNAPILGIPPNRFPGTASSTTIPFNALPGDVASYVGNGNNSYQVGYGNGNFSGSSNFSGIFFGGDANSFGSATVTYTYNPVPEPSSLLLLGFGLLGLYLAVSRRRVVSL